MDEAGYRGLFPGGKGKRGKAEYNLTALRSRSGKGRAGVFKDHGAYPGD